MLSDYIVSLITNIFVVESIVIHRMKPLPQSIAGCIQEASAEVQSLMKAAFTKVGGVAPTGSALDQNGLADGGDVVWEYLAAGEPGLALEHLIYMVHEPAIVHSPK